jgi:hypothetical protein
MLRHYLGPFATRLNCERVEGRPSGPGVALSPYTVGLVARREFILGSTWTGVCRFLRSPETAPTGALHDTSISSAWAERVLGLAARIDTAIGESR